MMDAEPLSTANLEKLQSIKVFSPATIANVGCGYDIMGFALNGLGETITVRRKEEPGLEIDFISGGFDLPMEADKNLATIAAQKLLIKYDVQDVGLVFSLEKDIHPGSGLGTSASSSAGAVFAVDKLLGLGLTEEELVQSSMEGEKAVSGKAHADNVAPAICGGFVVIRGYEPLDMIKVNLAKEIYVAIVHPQIQVKTMDAKRMLKKSLDLSQAITQWGNVAGMISGLYTGDLELVKRSMHDEVAEPVRSMLIPYYDQVKKKVLEAGAYGCNIAGSGPSIFAFTDSLEKAEQLTDTMLSVYKKSPVDAKGFVSGIANEGVRVL